MSDTLTISPAEKLAARNQSHFPNESQEYRAARNALLAEEISLRRQIEQVAAQRRALPVGGKIPKDFDLITETGKIGFSSLFGDKDTLMVYSMMYGPQRKAPCPMCTSFLTAWNGVAVNLRERVAIVGRRTGTLSPADKKGFRLAFDSIPESWNQTMPDLVIAGIVFE